MNKPEEVNNTEEVNTEEDSNTKEENNTEEDSNTEELMNDAILNGSLSDIEKLLPQANINEALITAASIGNIRVLEYLYSKGADLSYKNNEALNIAIDNRNLNVVKWLVSHGTEDDKNKALIIAVKSDSLKILKWLVSDGADPFTQNNIAVDIASQEGFDDIRDYLLDLGAKLYECHLPFWTKSSVFYKYDIDNIFLYYNIHNKYISVSEINNSISFDEKCEIINQYSPSKKWIKKMSKYIDNLSRREKEILRAYTYIGDRIINIYFRKGSDAALEEIKSRNFTPFLFIVKEKIDQKIEDILNGDVNIENLYIDTRKGKKMILNSEGRKLINEEDISSDRERILSLLNTFSKMIENDKGNSSTVKSEILDYLSDDFIEYTIEYTIHKMTKLFINAPKLDKDILVFRGNKEDFFTREKSFKSIGILSTTNNPEIALNFGKYLWRIYVSKGTRCIPMLNSKYIEESEIIFPHGTILKLDDCYILDNDDMVCEIELRENIEKIEIN